MKYSETHEWAVLDKQKNVAKVGLTKHMLNELGDVVYVQWPKIGKIIKSGELACILESTKAATDMYSPLSGEIIQINEVLCENIEAINNLPEKDNWLYKIKISSTEEYEDLMEKDEYEFKIVS